MKIGIDFVGITTPFYCHDGEGNFVLHKRSANCRDEQGRWDPGAGQLELHASLEENVLREVSEEYGCAGEITGRLPAHDIFREQNGVMTHWIAIPFFVKVKRGDVKINEPEKIDELGWFALDRLPEPLHTGFAHSLEMFKAEFKNILSNMHTAFKVRCRAVILHEGKLLVVKHKPDADYYALPGGHLEPGESVEECMKREIVEELGIEPIVGKLLYVHTLKDRHGNESLECYFEVTNGGTFLSIEEKERTHAFELAEIRWMSPGEEINLLPHVVAEDFKNGTLIHAGTRYTKG